MQKTQAPSERSASISAGRAGRQARRRSGVWLVPPPAQDEPIPLAASQLPQIVGALALDEAAEYAVDVASVSAPACALIIEDDSHTVGALRRALAEVAPAIMLLDARQPDVDGAEVYRRLRASPATRNCQAIFLTASTAFDLSARGVEDGIVLRKPFDVEQVITLVTALLEE